ncbi:MAG: NADH-quinone oxidoreductase subunit C [Bacteroidota bacterium]
MYIDKEKALETVKKITDEVESYEHRGQLTLTVPAHKIVDVATELRDNPETSFEQCLDITAIDWYDKRKPRFEVLYFLYSNKHTKRLRLKVQVEESDLHCPTLTGVWESANWYERETFDMYGIIFDGHPGLRRFYMPEDFNDPDTGEPLYPMRKDFPILGIPGSLPLPPYPEKYGPLEE